MKLKAALIRLDLGRIPSTTIFAIEAAVGKILVTLRVTKNMPNRSPFWMPTEIPEVDRCNCNVINQFCAYLDEEPIKWEKEVR